MSNTYAIMLYFGCGLALSASFEYLVYKTKWKDKDNGEVKNVKNWERTFWIICWPYLLLKFIIALFK